MSGHIQQKGKNWYCVIERGYGEDGRRLTPLWYSVRKELGLNKPATKTQARELLVKLLSEKQQGQIIKPKQIKFSAYLDYWLEQYSAGKNLAKNTVTQCNFAIKHIKPTMGHEELSKIRAAQIQEFLTSKSKHYAPSSVHTLHKILNIAFKQAIKWEYITVNPMENVIRPPKPKPDIQYWTEEEVSAFLAVAKGRAHYTIYRLALATGMRKLEMLNLTGGQIDYDNHTITIVDAKTKSGWRTIDVSPKVIDALPRVGEKEYLFPGKNGPLNPGTLNKAMKSAAKAAGVKEITVHGLRHTFATLMLSRGANIRGLAETLGHANPAQLWQTYAHLLPSKQKEAAQMMDDLLE